MFLTYRKSYYNKKQILKQTNFNLNNKIKEKIIEIYSSNLEINYSNDEKIFLIYQYFIPDNNYRKNEIKTCMKKNFLNKNIYKIILLNELEYNNEELGLEDFKEEEINEKIQQIVIEKRIKFNDIYEYVENENINGFIVMINSDIFLDDTISNLNKIDINQNKFLISLLRYEYNKNIRNLDYCKLFKNDIGYDRSDSQDTWIYHSKYNIPKDKRKIFDIFFGQPGCDNRLLYLYKILGYKLYNTPKLIKTYHYHTTIYRKYNLPRIIKNCLLIVPYDEKNVINKNTPYIKLINYLNEKIDKNKSFVIPRIAGIENHNVYISVMFKNNLLTKESNYQKLIKMMKNNAGIHFTSFESTKKYGELYLKSFDNCECFLKWNKYDTYYNTNQKSNDYITNKYKNKIQCYANDMNIFDNIINPWTHCLRNKKLLIISSFCNSIKNKEQNFSKIYDVDLFPGCSFVYLKPPQTNGTNPSRDFQEELNDFCENIKKIKESEDFDIALVSCGGYGNLVCNYIYSLDRSAIYVGGVLQMYFGILGSRWKMYNPEVVELYQNDYWSYPSEDENASYW
ncbi:hypothetical protein CL656_05645 [bacterium]|nr:hypothetical protein [bacterium]